MAAIPSLPLPPAEYDQTYFDALNRAITAYLRDIQTYNTLRGISLNLDINRLPTSANYSTLRSGDIYRDTVTAADALGGYMLRIKP